MDPVGYRRFGLLGSLCGRPTDPPGCGTHGFTGEKHDEERMLFFASQDSQVFFSFSKQ